MPYTGIRDVTKNKFEADGLAFSYTPINEHDLWMPKSLKVILREVERDVYQNESDSFEHLYDSNLKRWANQGVLLLNTALTTLAGNTGSHLNIWQPFTEYVINTIDMYIPGCIFLLWGEKAKEYKNYLGKDKIILEAPHPAAQFYSGGKITFSGCSHFSKVNKVLTENNGRDSCIRW